MPSKGIAMNYDETKAKASAEELLKSTARNVSELASMATHQLGESVNRGKTKLNEMQVLLTDKTKEYARHTDHYVQENPWRAVGIAAGAGLIIGLLISRR
jgi:ElaB/YqjD/DUF883 family membrane-anchored ribosome-binding protein